MFGKNKNITNVPTHVAFIMDGNGRWATSKGMPRQVGHKQGMYTLSNLIEFLVTTNVRYATFFAFSTENWKRDKAEIEGLFSLVRQFLEEKKDSLLSLGVKITYIGDISRFPSDLQQRLLEVVEKTKKCEKLTCVFALNYGGRWDILQAVNHAIEKKKGCLSHEDIEVNLSTAFMPDPDLIIRTGKEKRVSNYMLYQMAYSEFIFTDVLWPDFSSKHLIKCFKEYASRNRRYGGVK